MNKSPLIALMLAFIPGAGHAYLGRPFRTVLYGGAFFGSSLIAFLILISHSRKEEFVFFFVFVAAFSWLINMIDMIISLVSGKTPGLHASNPNYGAYSDSTAGYMPLSYEQQREKSRTIMLSFLPGLGHMSLGLMQRGITFLISFVGLFAIIVFLSIIMNTGALLIFLFILPVIWVYSMFDTIQHLHAKQRGEQLVDHAIFEDLEAHISSGRKNKVLAIALSIFPGAGHLYLGLQKRGLQLMGGFLLAIYIMDNMRLSLFFFLLPLFWCFAFFDALQQTTRYERNELTDEPILKQFVPYQRWFGIALMGFGVYYLLNRVVADMVMKNFTRQMYEAYMSVIYVIPTVVVSFVLIFIGLRLTFGSKTADSKRAVPPPLAPPVYKRKEEGSK
ncbi:hypothetical protein FHS15_005026 [Paenibacillus castaneae]|uniref:hypothetical protein n=1 Tax=Paenibacillus castaneae TaxID=474957 RepID=UPI000C9B3391|nr:hypothetical protein [Paenibacillus castaneae]NIK79859.1 hypothetical protein [Paenibacillus castaneae]